MENPGGGEKLRRGEELTPSPLVGEGWGEGKPCRLLTRNFGYQV